MQIKSKINGTNNINNFNINNINSNSQELNFNKKKENETTNNFNIRNNLNNLEGVGLNINNNPQGNSGAIKRINSNFLKSNQNYFSMHNMNIKSMGSGLENNNNPINKHQRYKSQNIEINTDFHKMNFEENKNKEKNIYTKFSPINNKDFNATKTKNNFNFLNNIGNFTSNNFKLAGNNNNKFFKCNLNLKFIEKFLINFLPYLIKALKILS